MNVIGEYGILFFLVVNVFEDVMFVIFCYLFVIGKLVVFVLWCVFELVSDKIEFEYEIWVLLIIVVVLMIMNWVVKCLKIDKLYDKIFLFGYCYGLFELLCESFGIEIEWGFIDLKSFFEYFGLCLDWWGVDYGCFDIEIIVEINYVFKFDILCVFEIVVELWSFGVDLIDFGLIFNFDWMEVGEFVWVLKGEGYWVLIDLLMLREIGWVVDVGVELVFSVNCFNCEWVVEWGCEVVVILDMLNDMVLLDEMVEFLVSWDVLFWIDLILELIGCGFVVSLWWYMVVCEWYLDVFMMMGIGNFIELIDVDLVGINVILFGFC